MTGIASESGLGNNAEGFHTKGIGHHGYEAIQLQPGRFWMLFEFGTQEQFTAEPWEMGGWHMVVSGFGPDP